MPTSTIYLHITSTARALKAWRGMTWRCELRAQKGCAETISPNILKLRIAWQLKPFILIKTKKLTGSMSSQAQEQMLRLVAAILDCLKFTLPFNISNVVQPNRALFHSLGGAGGCRWRGCDWYILTYFPVFRKKNWPEKKHTEIPSLFSLWAKQQKKKAPNSWSESSNRTEETEINVRNAVVEFIWL